MNRKRRSFTVALRVVAFGLIIIAGLVLTGFFQHDHQQLKINEIMASNRIVLADHEGDYPDWIEIFNGSKEEITLGKYWLSTHPTELEPWVFPDVKIGAGEYLIVFASGKDYHDVQAGVYHTNFVIGRSGDAVLLGSPEGRIVDRVVFSETIPSNVSLGRVPDEESNWAYFLNATPGAPNTTEPYSQVLDMPILDELFPVRVNEFMSVNRSSLEDEDGDLSDWIEFYNTGPDAVSLVGYWLSDKTDNPYKWRFPQTTIQAGEYLVVFASGKNRADPQGPYLHTTFALNDADDTILFSTPEGKIIEEILIRDQYRDASYGRDEQQPDRWLYYSNATPGETNSTEGKTSLAGFVPEEWGNLHINEVMAVNLSTIRDEDGDYPSWVEIFNSSDEILSLKGFGLSDRENDPFRWRFPDVSIAPGEQLLVFTSRKARQNPNQGHLHTNFQIQPTGETVILTHPTGITMDKLHTGRLIPDVSIGRQPDGSPTRYLFEQATPGTVNSTRTYAGYATAPRLSLPGGFYQDEATVALYTPAVNATILYTLDGSDPHSEFLRYNRSFLITDSARLQPPRTKNGTVYAHPLRVTSTTVIRARAYEEGKLPSEAVQATYFFNIGHSLPVLSVYVDPDEMFDPVRGMYMRGSNSSPVFPHKGANYWQNIELPVHMEMYEQDGTRGFAFDLGMRIAGAYSRADPQKSFNLFARNIYGHNEFTYPFFIDFPNKPTTHKAITLRTSGQDWRFTKIRDIMMTSLLEDTQLDYQAYRQAVLYINGQYWGIYNIRERINPHYLKYNHGIDPEQLDILQGNGWVRDGSNAHYRALEEYARKHNLADAEHYAYMKTQMDIDNYVDYWIAQIYFAQTDSANIRFWREQSQNGIWRWITFDLDWAFWRNNYDHNSLAFVTNPQGTGYARSLRTTLMSSLLANREFRDLFIERLVYHLNHTFAPQRVMARIDQLADNIASEMPRQIDRWGGSMAQWEEEVEVLRIFARNRHRYLHRYIQEYFRLSDEEMRVFDGWGRE
jgi:hypothetical protein